MPHCSSKLWGPVENCSTAEYGGGILTIKFCLVQATKVWATSSGFNCSVCVRFISTLNQPTSIFQLLVWPARLKRPWLNSYSPYTFQNLPFISIHFSFFLSFSLIGRLILNLLLQSIFSSSLIILMVFLSYQWPFLNMDIKARDRMPVMLR